MCLHASCSVHRRLAAVALGEGQELSGTTALMSPVGGVDDEHGDEERSESVTRSRVAASEAERKNTQVAIWMDATHGPRRVGQAVQVQRPRRKFVGLQPQQSSAGRLHPRYFVTQSFGSAQILLMKAFSPLEADLQQFHRSPHAKDLPYPIHVCLALFYAECTGNLDR